MLETYIRFIIKLPFFILIASPSISYSQTMTAYRDTVPEAYNFWIYTPKDYDSIQCIKPVIIFLHGNSLCGDDLSKVLHYGCLDAIEMGHKIDAVIIAPQNSGGMWKPYKILNIYNWVNEHYNIDTSKVYVIGMSLGGYGTIDFVGTYPEKVAAAIALCGGGTLNSYCGLTRVPLWIIHGTADRAVGISESQKIVNAMIACGDTSLLRFDKLKGERHSSLARIFYLERTYEWLFAHNSSDSIRTINKEYIINSDILGEAYKNSKMESQKITYINTQKNISIPEGNSNVAYHTIKNGDTLSSIALRYKTSVTKLCKLNNIKETTILRIGIRLRVK